MPRPTGSRGGRPGKRTPTKGGPRKGARKGAARKAAPPKGGGTYNRPGAKRGPAREGAVKRGPAKRGPAKRGRPAVRRTEDELVRSTREEAATPSRPSRPDNSNRAKISLARALSKLGFTSRSAAIPLITGGRVRVNGKVHKDPNHRIDIERDKVTIDNKAIEKKWNVYVVLNKPRGLVTTRSDERGRDTVFECLKGGGFPYISPVGRLDKDSEGMLIFTNDTRWGDSITDPTSHIDKTYRVEIDTVADDDLMNALTTGVVDEQEHLAAKRAKIIKRHESTAWIEIVIDEGKSRHIRRLLAKLGVGVLRLKRVAIGKVKLGGLGEGKFRELTAAERKALGA
jgi:23S rRNA pseudouridine2605 synthase